MEWHEVKKSWTINEHPGKDEVEVWPVDSLNNERVWKWGYERVLANPSHLQVRRINGKKVEVHRRNYPSEGSLPSTLWDKPKYAAGSHGTNLLTKMFNKSHVFDFPKSVFAVQDCLYVCSAKKNAVILDFFAGSGTTGHSVLEMNNEDGGSRSFILCTNNENKIAEEVTYPRIRSVMDGYRDVKGIPANLRYFKTSFVSKSSVSDDTRYELVSRSCEMICVREDTYSQLVDELTYKIFENGNKYTAIIFNIDHANEFKKQISKLDDKQINLYVFSLTSDTYEDAFSDVSQSHKLCPIPESILEVYRRIFKEQIWN
jgi:adenine-specific DNA-methyltransferase